MVETEEDVRVSVGRAGGDQLVVRDTVSFVDGHWRWSRGEEWEVEVFRVEFIRR